MFKIRYVLLFLVVLAGLSFTGIHAQTINKFGIKGGPLLNNLSSSFNDDPVYSGFYWNSQNKTTLLSFDVGIFVELFNTPKFSVSTELHYNIKGEENKSGVKVLAPSSEFPNAYEFRTISDRFQYLSLQLLPQWKFEINTNDKLYLFVGPKFDYRIGNYNSGDQDDLVLENSKIEFGFVGGIGNVVWDLFYLELRYEYSISNIYKIEYGEAKFGRNNSSFLLLIGISLKKLLKIDL